jgi:hypothetical protein
VATLGFASFPAFIAMIVLATILAAARKVPAEQGDASRCAH